MQYSSHPSQKYLSISIFLVFFAAVTTYSATNLLPGGRNLNESTENGFSVQRGTSEEISVWSDCRKVTATTEDIYVPTKTLQEWNAFKTNAYREGIGIDPCAPICTPHACTAPEPSCGTTTTGTSDSCGTPCSKTGPDCVVNCPGGFATVLSPDQSPGRANSCSFSWGGGYWRSYSDYSTQSLNGTGDPAGSAFGSCNQFGSWNYTFTCANKIPGPVTCIGGGYNIVSSDGSNVCRFDWPTINAGQSASIGSSAGSPSGSANGNCWDNNGVGQWSYAYSCPNRALPSCYGGGGNFGTPCYFNWGGASAGQSASAYGSPGGYISADCVIQWNGTADWQITSFSCPY